VTGSAAPDFPAHRYALLASSITGVETPVSWAEPDEPTWTDGRTIHVARGHAARAREAVAIQAALIAGGALDPAALAVIRHRPVARSRYLALEVPRCIGAIAARLPPGLPAQRIAPTTRSAAESARRATRRSRDDAPPDPLWGELRPQRVLASSEALVTGPRRSLVESARRARTDDGTEPDERGASRFGDAFRGGGMVRRRPRGREARRGRTATHGHLTSGSGQRPAAAVHAVPRVTRASAGLALTDEPPRRGAAVGTYPEWSERERRYLPGWCAVHLVGLERDPEAAPPDRDPPGADLRRQVAELRLELAHVRRSPDGPDLDLDALVEARVDATTIGLVDDCVYIASRRCARDLTVVVLVDASASTRRATKAASDVLTLHRAAAAGLVRAFEVNDDRVACMGFRSFGRRRVEILPVKHFAHRFDLRASARLHQLRPSGFTRLGAAIRHASAVLRADAATRHRLLIVLSDGFPFDSGYEGRYAAADARMALAEARRIGIGPVAVSLGTGESADALRAVFGAAAHAAAATLADLTPRLSPLFADALRSAERARG